MRQSINVLPGRVYAYKLNGVVKSVRVNADLKTGVNVKTGNRVILDRQPRIQIA